MVRIELQLINILLLIASSVISAPNGLDDVLDVNITTEHLPDIESHQNDSSPPDSDADAEIPNGSRTLIMFGVLQWLFGIAKALIKPARNMYITMMPEITAFRCLSESTEFQNIMGFSGGDFEEYAYETPRTPDASLPIAASSRERNPDTDRVTPEKIYEQDFLQKRLSSGTRNFPEEAYGREAYSISQTTEGHAGVVLKRIPRFIDEFASLLREGQFMKCIMPYMKERVIRWIDS